MKQIVLILIFLLNSLLTFCQLKTITKNQLLGDLNIFKNIRESINSGIYRYRTKQQIDSIYNWASSNIKDSSNVIDFFKIICQITDFEGSLHNETKLPEYLSSYFMKNAYVFPYPVKIIENKLLINFSGGKIALGSEIISINGIKTEIILNRIQKYYTTDGYNLSGKQIGISANFQEYYLWEFGSFKNFQIEYRRHHSKLISKINIKGSTLSEAYENFKNRHSKIFDSLYLQIPQKKYEYKKLSERTAIFKINSFLIGWDSQDKEHLAYVNFLDSIFKLIRLENKIKTIIVDIRTNGGGSDPNDTKTLSYLLNQPFKENKSAFISCDSLKYIEFLTKEEDNQESEEKRIKDFQAEIKSEFNNDVNGKFYQDQKFNPLISPSEYAFTGKIILLIGPRVASAGSSFASVLACRLNTIVIGEETQGGYYGHNGHTPVEYTLPNSEISFEFSIVNLEQFVEVRKNQIYGRGLMPDIEIKQTYNDFIKNEDTVMKYILKKLK